MPRPKVLLSIHHQLWSHVQLQQYLLKALPAEERYEVCVLGPYAKPYENSLNSTVKEFLAGEFVAWINIDTDNPPIGNPLDLVERVIGDSPVADVIGCPTPIWKYKGDPSQPLIIWNVFRRDPKGSDAYVPWVPATGFQQVDVVGTGCLVLARRVFEHPDLQTGAFMRVWNPDGTVEKGNDVAFCERARAAGFSIWADWDYPCSHWYTVNLADIMGWQRHHTGDYTVKGQSKPPIILGGEVEGV